MNAIAGYFDLHRNLRQTTPVAMAGGGSNLSWQFQYMALLLGIIIQPYFAHFQQHREWALTAVPGWIAFSIIVALVCFPGVYRKSFDPEQPMVVQVIPIFTAGLGWQSLFTTVMNTAGAK